MIIYHENLHHAPQNLLRHFLTTAVRPTPSPSLLLPSPSPITMSGELDADAGRDSMNKLKGLQISSSDEGEEPPISDDLTDSEDADDEDRGVGSIILGFVEKPKNRRAFSRESFPSKAGSVPAWLDPVNLPSGKACLCDLCGEPLQFLLQVHAPFKEKDSTSFRTLYVFMCPSMACLLRDQHEQWKHGPEKPSRSLKVFRCQLACSNPFYSSGRDGAAKPLGAGVPLCSWCGTWKGEKVCSSCKRARYCSVKHQDVHWRLGHKAYCRQIAVSLAPGSSLPNVALPEETPKVACKSLWPEFLIIDGDSESNGKLSGSDKHAGSLVMKQRMDEASLALLEKFEGDDEKKSWALFQERMAEAPGQVLRYCEGVGLEPLWPTFSGRPSKADIPCCSYCGGERCFEFQILPQLLYYFEVKNDADSLDWATIAVYTCVDSCEASIAYKEEFAWVQLSNQSV